LLGGGSTTDVLEEAVVVEALCAAGAAVAMTGASDGGADAPPHAVIVESTAKAAKVRASIRDVYITARASDMGAGLKL
jgi:hypothetical protein